MRRLTDVDECKAVTNLYPEDCDIDITEWFNNKKNYAQIEEDNIGFAEEKSPGVFWIHFCFNSARGRGAISLASRMIDQLYEDKGFKAVVGLVRQDNKKASFVCRKIGMKSQGLVDADGKSYEMFTLIKESPSESGI